MRRRPTVLSRTIGEETIAVDLAGQNAYGFNPTGDLVWSMLGDHTEDEIAAAVTERFGIPVARAAADVQAFLADLEARGLIAEP